MAFVTKEEPVKQLIDGLGTQTLSLKPQLPIKEEITPVFDVNRVSTIHLTVVKTSTGTTPIFTIPTGKTFYLTSAYLEVSQDVACDQVASYINYVGEKGSVRVLQITPQTLTAGRANASISYPYPIKVTGTSINLIPTFTVGTQTSLATISGFLL